MFEFTPIKIEYDVTDIKGTEIHAMDGITTTLYTQK